MSTLKMFALRQKGKHIIRESLGRSPENAVEAFEHFMAKANGGNAVRINFHEYEVVAVEINVLHTIRWEDV